MKALAHENACQQVSVAVDIARDMASLPEFTHIPAAADLLSRLLFSCLYSWRNE